MDAATTFDVLSKVVGFLGGIIGAIGGFIGIRSSVRAQRREDERKLEEENDFNFLAAFMKKQVEVGDQIGRIYTNIEIGSKGWEQAEKMVQRGILERGPKGKGYCLRGFYERKADNPRLPRIQE